ncbi:MAG: AsmA family protein, partial [Rhodobacteraceae bacterium]
MRLIKAVIVACLGIVVLVIAALFLLPTQRIAMLAATQFEAATGRGLVFGGDVSPSFYPVIGASARNVSIGNPEWAGPGAMLEAAEMDIGLNLAALIRGDIEIERIVLQEPRLHLRRDASGRVNWDFARDGVQAPRSDAPTASTSAPRSISLAEARINGASLRFSDAQSGTDLHLQGVNARLQMPVFAGPAEITASGEMNGQDFEISARIDHAERFLSGGLAQLSFDATAAGTSITFAGRAGLENLTFEGQVNANLPALHPVMQLIGQTGGDVAPDFLPLGLTGQVTRTADGRIFAREAQFRAGTTRLSGGADLIPGGDRPRVTGQFAGDILDLRSPGSGGGGGSAAAPAQGWSRTPIDASALGLIDADISLTLNGMRTDIATLGRTRLGLSIDRARAVTELREVALFGGQLTGEFVMNNRSGLSVGGSLRARGLDLLPLLTELADYRRLQGQADMDLQFLGVGNTMQAIMDSLRGEGRIDFAQGEIIGFDLAGMLRNLDMSYMGAGNRTVFQSLTGSFTIDGGVLRNDDLRLEASRFNVTGRGTVGLGARNLDYRVVPAAVRGDDTFRVPLMITGPWAEPRFRLDMEALAREQLRVEQERLEEIAREEAARLEDRARSELEERLQRELNVQREEGERVQDTIRRGVEQELGNRLQR